MNKEKNTRTDFLKGIAWTLAAIFSFGLVKLKDQNRKFPQRDQINFLSVDEANDHLRNMKTTRRNIKPEPPPNRIK